jgi:hypothetical protein
MKKIIYVFLILTSGFAYGSNSENSNASERGRRIGIGVSFSRLTGVSLYADTSYKDFVQAVIAFTNDNSYAATADYAFGHHYAFSSIPSVTPYWGLGAVLLHDQSDYWSNYARDASPTSTYLGARIPVGLNLLIPNTPVQFAAEIAPSLLFKPAIYSFLQGSFSVRILF